MLLVACQDRETGFGHNFILSKVTGNCNYLTKENSFITLKFSCAYKIKTPSPLLKRNYKNQIQNYLIYNIKIHVYFPLKYYINIVPQRVILLISIVHP